MGNWASAETSAEVSRGSEATQCEGCNYGAILGVDCEGGDPRYKRNKKDIDNMNKELSLYQATCNAKTENETGWDHDLKRAKNKILLQRAKNLVQNTARELYTNSRACDHVIPATILAQPKLAAIISAMTPTSESEQWYERIKLTAEKVDERIDALDKLQEETKKRTRAAHATVLTTLMAFLVNYANGVIKAQDTQEAGEPAKWMTAEMISELSPICLTLLLAIKTLIESRHDRTMQGNKKKFLVGDYKSVMYDISRFSAEGAKPEGAAETKEDEAQTETQGTSNQSDTSTM